MSAERAVSLRELAFVRDVLIPRCAWVEGPEVQALVQLRLRIDAIFAGTEGTATVPSTDREARPAEAADVPTD